jgi:hypothetical protein
MSKISSIYNSPIKRREIYSDNYDIFNKSKAQSLSDSIKAPQVNSGRRHYERYDEYAHTKVTFGKHKGKWLSEVPIDYVKWAVMNLDPYTATIFSVELQRREPKLRK